MATISRLLKITGLFCKRALSKRLNNPNVQNPRTHLTRLPSRLIIHTNVYYYARNIQNPQPGVLWESQKEIYIYICVSDLLFDESTTHRRISASETHHPWVCLTHSISLLHSLPSRLVFPLSETHARIFTRATHTLLTHHTLTHSSSVTHHTLICPESVSHTHCPS